MFRIHKKYIYMQGIFFFISWDQTKKNYKEFNSLWMEILWPDHGVFGTHGFPLHHFMVRNGVSSQSVQKALDGVLK